jgi:hypothetical protein
MKERPILFSAPMVIAIREKRKTQTRRIVKLDRGHFVCDRTSRFITACEMKDGVGPWWHPHGGHPGEPLPQDRIESACPHGKPGDRLWVRETWNSDWCDKTIYRADGGSAREAGYASEPRWRPSIHMPRRASRITLEITDVRVERLRDISEEDAEDEGAQPYDPTAYFTSAQMGGRENLSDWEFRAGFAELWNSINGINSWDQNPWVWAITFKDISKEARD